MIKQKRSKRRFRKNSLIGQVKQNLNTGQHIRVKNMISTKQIAKTLGVERYRVTRLIYPIKKYFRKEEGKVLCRHKPEGLDVGYFFAETTEERHTFATERKIKAAAKLRSIAEDFAILQGEDPQLKLPFKEKVDGLSWELPSPK